MAYSLLDPCPCRSGNSYNECCHKYHEGLLAENALVLMRSRYSAYALHLADYIVNTTHPDHRELKKGIVKYREEILFFSKQTQFEKLEVHSFHEQGEHATVTFTAHLNQGGSKFSFTEESRFEKILGKWLYLEGKIRDAIY